MNSNKEIPAEQAPSEHMANKHDAFIEEILSDPSKSNMQELKFADAVKHPQSTGDGCEAVLGLEETGENGKTMFVPNNDTNRIVKKYPYPSEGVVLRLSWSNKGVMVSESHYHEVFGKDLQMLPDMMQVTFMLTDGRTLLGHVAKPKHGKARVCLPTRFWPEDIAAPEPGLMQRVSVTMLIIG